MPKKRKPHRRNQSQARSATARKDPRLSVGDVIFLIQRETWRAVGVGDLNGAIAAAVAVLAATARIGREACRNILLEDWKAGRVVVATRTGERTPVLLEIAVEVVDRYLAERERVERALAKRSKKAGRWLFINREGNQLPKDAVAKTFGILGRHCRVPGYRLPKRCLQFFDRSLDGEDDDRAAVVALAGWRDRGVDAEVHRHDVAEAAADPDRLRQVLEDNHELAGPAGRFLGTRGMELAAETRNIFITQDRIPRNMSEAMRSEPACVALGKIVWPDRGKKKLRLQLKELYFDRLDELRLAGRLRLGEIAYLFSCSPRAVEHWIKARRLAAKSPELLAEEASWLEAAPAMYLERPRGETPTRFHARLVDEHDCTVPRIWLMSVLHHAGVLGPRPRSKAKAGG
ncbi:hypothetical protein ABIF52_003814 [Bradyrhizobium japonicum]